jgi:predicted flavoprotein YhiN
LIATGGVSYPKTGSVGDGQKWASSLGHKITPYRPGLAGFDMPPAWIHANPVRSIPNVTLKIIVGGKAVATTEGFLEIEKYGIGGPAVTNASRIIARRDLKNYSFEVDMGGKKWTLNPVRVRPLKEAMVTVGGIALNEVDSRTMESKKVPGLFFAGEILDIDGPSGGYNLQAAFSTARLAMDAIAKRLR